MYPRYNTVTHNHHKVIAFGRYREKQLRFEKNKPMYVSELSLSLSSNMDNHTDFGSSVPSSSSPFGFVKNER